MANKFYQLVTKKGGFSSLSLYIAFTFKDYLVVFSVSPLWLASLSGRSLDTLQLKDASVNQAAQSLDGASESMLKRISMFTAQHPLIPFSGHGRAGTNN